MALCLRGRAQLPVRSYLAIIAALLGAPILSVCGSSVPNVDAREGTSAAGATIEFSAVEGADAAWSAPPFSPGRSSFVLEDWGGPAIPVWVYVPAGIDTTNAPILIVMHGAKRAPRRYLNQWVDQAEARGFIVVAPEFSRADFPRSVHYNLGNVHDGQTGALIPESQWSFSAIEPVFDAVVAGLGGEQQRYTLYGHSAGSQFVHRFAYLKPDARVSRFMAANAGWYTFADRQIDYPFGLGQLAYTDAELQAILALDLVVLLGDQDNDPDHESLNRSAGAMLQGRHRFARGKSYFDAARDLAAKKGWSFGWSLRVIKGAAHENGKIAQGAADLVE